MAFPFILCTQWFEKKAEDFDLLDTQLKTLLEALEDTVAYRKGRLPLHVCVYVCMCVCACVCG